jgi:hypothetical protein
MIMTIRSDFYVQNRKKALTDTQTVMYRTVVQEFINDNYYEKGVLQRSIARCYW